MGDLRQDWTTAKVLDHGFVHLLDAMPHWNSPPTGHLAPADARVVQAARVSMAHLPDEVLASLGISATRLEERSSEQDAKLIEYAGKKGDALTDLKKARWYLDRAIKQAEAGR